MMVRCMTCQHIIIGQTQRTIGCTCDPDAPTWVGIDNDQRIMGGTYSYWLRLDDDTPAA